MWKCVLYFMSEGIRCHGEGELGTVVAGNDNQCDVSAAAREGRRLWEILGFSLFFLDTLSASIFLPVLPVLVSELGAATPASAAAWVGLLVGAYYAGRSSSLVALARFCSASPPTPCRLRVGVVLALSTASYLACGLAVGHQGLWWLATVRVLSGVLAAAHQALAFGCLELALLSRSQHEDHGGSGSVTANSTPGAPRGKAKAASIAGLVIGYAVAGALLSPGHARPAFRLCLVAAGAHVPSVGLLLLIWRHHRGGTAASRNAAGWSAVANSDASRHSPVRGRAGGSEFEVEMTKRPAATAATDGPAAFNERGIVGGGASTAVGGAAAAGFREGSNDEEIRVPDRYLRGCKGDPVEAERRWRLTLEWRAKERVDEVRAPGNTHVPYAWE